MNTNAAVELTAEDCAIHKVQESFGKDFSHDHGTFSTVGVQCSIPSADGAQEVVGACGGGGRSLHEKQSLLFLVYFYCKLNLLDSIYSPPLKSFSSETWASCHFMCRNGMLTIARLALHGK